MVIAELKCNCPLIECDIKRPMTFEGNKRSMLLAGLSSVENFVSLSDLKIMIYMQWPDQARNL
jgi:hypothetical protein